MDPIMLNKVGMPPPTRSIQRRRRDADADAEAGERSADSGNQLIVSIIAFGVMLVLGLLLAWLVL
jgi:hypothetical protein